MREILFRGKTLAKGEWIYGDLIRDDDDVCILQEGLIWREIIPESVGEYIGLKDKNGNKVFEGDIVRYKDTLHEVIFCKINGCAFFGITMPDRGEIWNFDGITRADRMEVIGNVHDGGVYD